MFSGAGCLPVSMPQSAWLALHLQISVTDWSPLRTGATHHIDNLCSNYSKRQCQMYNYLCLVNVQALTVEHRKAHSGGISILLTLQLSTSNQLLSVFIVSISRLSGALTEKGQVSDSDNQPNQ